jgi:transposase
VHTVTTGLLTLLVVHPRRGVEAMADIGVFDGYTGTIVHDGVTAYDTFTTAAHAQCGAHLLRHLDDVGQTVAFALWTRQLAGILCAARDASTAAAAAGLGSVPTDIAAKIRSEFHATLDVAFALLPDGTPPRRRHTGGWNHAQRKAFNLATRLRTGEPQVLRLLADTRVPFTNNTAERSLRMVKIHDKISGTFQTEQGAARFATVRSYLQTADAHGHNLLDACRELFTTGAWIPPPAGAIT